MYDRLMPDINAWSVCKAISNVFNINSISLTCAIDNGNGIDTQIVYKCSDPYEEKFHFKLEAASGKVKLSDMVIDLKTITHISVIDPSVHIGLSLEYVNDPAHTDPNTSIVCDKFIDITFHLDGIRNKEDLSYKYSIGEWYLLSKRR